MASRTSLTLNPGDRLGDYQILEPLGAGGMGAVFKVRHEISHRVEALKIVLPQASASEQIADRFLREIRLLAALQHVNIGAFYNAFRAGDQFAMAMEFVEGISLREKLRENRISLAHALSYGGQILTALAYAHGRGVIHRDIKPSNIMIQPDGTLKLLDFGLATSQPDAQLTQPGTLLGSPHYMSPEQARGEKADARSDLYSTGAVLYELASGKPPFNFSETYAVIAPHLYQSPRPLREVNAHVPVEFSRIVQKALAKDPDQRFQSAKEFLEALKAAELDNTKTLFLEPAQSTDLPARERTPAPRDESGIGPAEIDQVSKDLAVYIGPIAQIVVKRAAVQSRTLSELYHSVSLEISSAGKRHEFLAKMPTKAANRSAS